MIATLDIRISKDDHDYNEREQLILEFFFRNLAAQANAQATGGGAMLNPLEKQKNDLFYEQMVWQSSISEEQFSNLKEGALMRFNSVFKVCKIDKAQVIFEKNKFITQK